MQFSVACCVRGTQGRKLGCARAHADCGERKRELGRVAGWARLGEEGARRAAARGKQLGRSCWAAWPCARERAKARSGELGLLAPVGPRGGERREKEIDFPIYV